MFDRLVREAGGFIGGTSELGRGTTIRVFLPRAATPPRETLLVVEDDPLVRQIATRSLRRLGYRVLVAENGVEALRLCEESPNAISLVVTDLVMPRMSGADLVARLGSICPATKVLYMTGYPADAIDRHGGLGEGAAILQKPFTPDHLAQRVRVILDTDGHELGKRRARVLVVDDSDAHLRVMTALLRADYDVRTIHGGAAQAIIDSQDFDVVLCDVMMPDVSGCELYRHVLARDPGLARRFVFASGLPNETVEHMFGGRPPRPVLVKPIETDVLNAVIAEVLGESAIAGDAGR
jgi:CheY-like chemotaxis protein